MHIPDGYLGPQTYGAAYVVMIPIWTWASRRVSRTLRLRQVPVLAMGAAFSFLVMMFNVPIPGGTTGHAVGAVLVAILLGPWAAVLAVSLVLLVQALLFGDGGITSYAANCLNMAVIMPFAGWWVFRLVGAGAPPGSKRRWLAAAAGGYLGLNAAALSTSVMLGLQPLIAHDAAGRPLYAPFGLNVTVPVMMGEHLLLFGVVEALITASVLAFLERTEPLLVAPQALPRSCADISTGSRRLWVGLALLALLTPLGILLPWLLGSKGAWGEWGAEELKAMTGWIPAGLAKLSALWRAPAPDYGPPGAEGQSLAMQSVWYILSALAGSALVVGVVLFVRRWLWGRKPDDAST